MCFLRNYIADCPLLQEPGARSQEPGVDCPLLQEHGARSQEPGGHLQEPSCPGAQGGGAGRY